jgi:hypothetical protein
MISPPDNGRAAETVLLPRAWLGWGAEARERAEAKTEPGTLHPQGEGRLRVRIS